MNIYTFKKYWVDFHEVNPQYKLNTSRAKELFEKCNCIGRKKKLIRGVEKSKLSGLEYLKLNL